MLDSATPEEGRYLEALFDLADEGAALHAGLRRWLARDAGEGLHPADHLLRLEELRARFAALPVPERLEAVHGRVDEALRRQRDFVAEWSEALREGRPFASQLEDEFAYHEGLHRSQRMLLQAYAELRALFPEAAPETTAAFRRHLRGLDLQ